MGEHFAVTESDRARFWSRVNKNADGGCWIWTALKYTHGGYGQFYCAGKYRRAHRVSLVMHGIALVDGLQCDHLCRVRTCVNPAHIEQVEPKENTRRGRSISTIHAAKKSCGKCGGPYTKKTNGNRYCRVCANVTNRKSRANRRKDPSFAERKNGQSRARRAAMRALRLAESLAARLWEKRA